MKSLESLQSAIQQSQSYSTLRDIENLTKKDFAESKIYDELFSIESDIARRTYYNQLLLKAAEVGAKKVFAETYKIWEDDFKEKRKEQKPSKSNKAPENYTDFKKAPIQYKCGSYIATHDGVYKESDNGRIDICSHPIWIESELYNISSKTYKVKLCFTNKRGKLSSLVVDKESISTKAKILKLGNDGIDVDDTNATQLIKYLAYLRRNNADIIPELTCTDQLGWVESPEGNGHIFLPYDKGIELDANSRMVQLLSSIEQKGDEEAYMKYIKEIRAMKDNAILINMAATLSSVLLLPLNVLPFVLSLWGKTGIGKTVMLKLNASIWGNPESGFISDAKTTKTALEINMHSRNHLPLLIDDLAQINDKNAKETLSAMVYQLCSGQGKERATSVNGDIRMKTQYNWRNCIITNGERALACEGSQGGVINRVIDVPVGGRNLFPDDKGNEICTFLTTNYGHIGKRFIEVLKEMPIEDIQRYFELSKKVIRNRIKQYEDLKEEKQIMSLAAIMVADQIATDYIYKDGIYIDSNWAIDLLRSKSDADENLAMYNNILDFYMANKTHFSGTRDGDVDLSPKYGFTEDNIIYFIPLELNKFINSIGGQMASFLTWMTEGRPYLWNGEAKRHLKTMRVGKQTAKFAAIPLSLDVQAPIIEDGVSEKDKDVSVMFLKVQETEECPFH